MIGGGAALDHLPQRLGRRGNELESRRAAVGKRLRRAVDDRIVEPAGRMDDRRRAVTLTVHLVHPARLEPRWHHESIGAAFDPMRERFVEADEARESTRTLRR